MTLDGVVYFLYNIFIEKQYIFLRGNEKNQLKRAGSFLFISTANHPVKK